MELENTKIKEHFAFFLSATFLDGFFLCNIQEQKCLGSFYFTVIFF